MFEWAACSVAPHTHIQMREMTFKVKVANGAAQCQLYTLLSLLNKVHLLGNQENTNERDKKNTSKSLTMNA